MFTNHLKYITTPDNLTAGKSCTNSTECGIWLVLVFETQTQTFEIGNFGRKYLIHELRNKMQTRLTKSSMSSQ